MRRSLLGVCFHVVFNWGFGCRVLSVQGGLGSVSGCGVVAECIAGVVLVRFSFGFVVFVAGSMRLIGHFAACEWRFSFDE